LDAGELAVKKPVCILKKLPDSQRLFCLFGYLIPQTGNPLLETSNSEIQPQVDFKFYKSQEIPEFRYSLEETPPSEATLSKAQSEDYLDFLVTITDNGDDKFCLSGKYFRTYSDSPGGPHPLKPVVHPARLPANPH